MNKQGWTYKTFGEVGSFLRGKSIQKADFVENGLPCIHYGQIHTKFGVSIDKHLSEIPLELYNKSIIASHGDVIIAITSEDLEGSCKSTAWLGDYDIAVSSHAAVYKHNLNPKFIAYYLRSKSFYYEKMKYARGFKVMEIKPTDIERIPIPVPPMAEQERIVAELDLLSGVIEKKKEQLKAYDQLAQSIFYTMFGDPIDNPKGWETKNMGDIGDLQRGSGLSKKDLTENGFPCILYGQIHTRFGAFTRKHIACIPQELVSTAKIAHFGDIVMAITSEDVEGSCKSVAWMGDYDIAVGSDAAIYRHTLNPIYVSYYTQTKAFYFEKAKYAKGFKVTHISTKEIAKIPIHVPPLSLQQEFAEKIEAIERQKALVQQSIEETQTMFDSRMDYFFD